MAENVKKLMGADYGISTTGVAGPSEDEFGSAVQHGLESHLKNRLKLIFLFRKSISY